VDRTAFRNLHKPALLTLIQVAGYLDFSLDTVQKTLFRFAVRAILGMHPEML
jgi:hypothetical protein